MGHRDTYTIAVRVLTRDIGDQKFGYRLQLSRQLLQGILFELSARKKWGSNKRGGKPSVLRNDSSLNHN
jgi:hypothetical protein